MTKFKHYTCTIPETVAKAFELLLRRVVQDSYGKRSRNEALGDCGYPDIYEYEVWVTDEEISTIRESYNVALDELDDFCNVEMKEHAV